MSKLFKILATLTLICLVSFTFLACGGSSSKESPKESPKESNTESVSESEKESESESTPEDTESNFEIELPEVDRR